MNAPNSIFVEAGEVCVDDSYRMLRRLVSSKCTMAAGSRLVRSASRENTFAATRREVHSASTASRKNTFTGKTPAPSACGQIVRRRFISYASTTHVVEVGDGGWEPPRSNVGDGSLMLPHPTPRPIIVSRETLASMTHVIEVHD